MEVRTEEAFQSAMMAAKGMSFTALRMLENDNFATEVKKEFERDCTERAREEAEIQRM